MSIKQMTLVFNSDIKPTKKLIMLSLADNANDSGVCFPTIENITKKTSLSRQSVNDNLKALVKDGLLLKKNRNRKNGSRTSNKYLLFPDNNFSELDEEDMIAFNDVYTQSQTDVPPINSKPKSDRCTPQSQTDVPPTPTQSQRGVHLEPSLISFNHHLLTITNKKMASQILEKVIENSKINIEALSEWLTLKKYKDISPITKIINFLSKYDFATQQHIVNTSIMNGYKGLFEPKTQKQPHNTPKMQQLNPDINIWDELDKATNASQGLLNG